MRFKIIVYIGLVEGIFLTFKVVVRVAKIEVLVDKVLVVSLVIRGIDVNPEIIKKEVI